MKAPDKIYVEVCEDGIFAFPEPPFEESIEYIRAVLVSRPKLSDNLEEAAEEYEKKHTYQRYDGGGLTPEYDATLAEAFIAGVKWQKEQMMKEAVEGTVHNFSSNMPHPTVLVDAKGFNQGDKVRIIIVKEDER